MSKLADFRLIRDALHVKRFHTVMHTAMPETVGHHTAGVIAILFYLFDDVPPIHLIRAALHHDIPETVTGDIPAHAKWAYPELHRALTEVEVKVAADAFLTPVPDEWLQVFKFADIFDLCLKSIEELAAGNDCYARVLDRGVGVLINLLNGPLHENGRAHELFMMIRESDYVEIGTNEGEPDGKARYH